MRQIKIFLLMVLIGIVSTSCISNDEIRAKQAEERDEIFNEGYEAGYECGYEHGYEDGSYNGYDEGYAEGYEEGRMSAYDE